MAKLILQFDGLVLKECTVGSQPVGIGRLPDNAVVIDNAAVSSRHARVFREGDLFIVEDLQSTNGTFVNEKPVTRQRLNHGDVMLIGKHTVIFEDVAHVDAPAAPPAPAKELPDLEGTFVLQTRQHKKMLQNLGIDQPQPSRPPADATQFKPMAAPAAPPPATTTMRTVGPAAPAAPKKATVHVLAGRTDQTTYDLSAHTSIVGKSDEALIKLRGWFKPKVALAIARKGDGYTVTPLGGKSQINGKPLDDRRDLKDGDVLQVSGLTLEFRLK